MEATTPNIIGVVKSLTIFKLSATTPNNTQQLVTTRNRVCMQTDALYNIQLGFVGLANNVASKKNFASVCTRI